MAYYSSCISGIPRDAGTVLNSAAVRCAAAMSSFEMATRSSRGGGGLEESLLGGGSDSYGAAPVQAAGGTDLYAAAEPRPDQQLTPRACDRPRKLRCICEVFLASTAPDAASSQLSTTGEINVEVVGVVDLPRTLRPYLRLPSSRFRVQQLDIWDDDFDDWTSLEQNDQLPSAPAGCRLRASVRLTPDCACVASLPQPHSVPARSVLSASTLVVVHRSMSRPRLCYQQIWSAPTRKRLGATVRRKKVMSFTN